VDLGWVKKICSTFLRLQYQSMAYRNGTYVAFHAEGKVDPTASDIRYYNLLKAWKVLDDSKFYFIDSHDKTGAIQDWSKRATVEDSLKERLRNSRNMVLILTASTRKDTDWVPLEISYAIDECEIPIIAAYPGYQYINRPDMLSSVWPKALADRLSAQTTHVIHLPFSREPLHDAIDQFDFQHFPLGGGFGIYSESAYRSWGLM